MSYKVDVQNVKDLSELIRRKEFSQLKLNQDYLRDIVANEQVLEPLIMESGNLRLLSQQHFVRNWMSPNTPFTRLLMKHSTGSGKTIGSLAMAMEFIKQYRQMANFSDTPTNVTIIGFSKHIFHKELMRHSEFGFISHDEIEEHKKLKHLAETGTQGDKDALTDFEMKIKKRLSNKQLGGFFKFYGYKEFFNRLFIFSDLDEKRALDKAKLNEDEILAGIKEGWISLNYDLIRSLANSLIICDEIHNVYNSLEINNYGIAIQTVINLYDSPGEMQKFVPFDDSVAALLNNSYIKAVYMSATPINNSPMEIIDLLNLLVPMSRLPNRQRLKKEDFFIDNRNLKPGGLDKIRTLIRGYVSFFRDYNPKYYPSSEIEGKTICLPPKVQREDKKVRGYSGTKIPYLKFVRCKMSPFHWKTYKAIYYDGDRGTLPPDGQALMDFALPNPEKGAKLGLFRTREIKHGLSGAPRKWKEKNKIELSKQQIGSSGNEVNIITGEFMNVNELGKYAAKHARIVADAIENIKSGGGKVVIIHQLVKISGVLFIQEVLRRNGILDEYSNPTEHTLCVKCGARMSNHGAKSKGKTNHDFMPARSVILHGDIDKTTMGRTIEKYNSVDNVNGDNYMFLIGSKMIREAYDFKAVQNLWIASVPANIPNLEQIFGRPIRKNSHLELPPERQHVSIRIYVSSTPDGKDLSYEERRYYEKLKDYLVIQEIDKVFNEEAIDGVLHRRIIYPDEQAAAKAPPGLGTLYFKPSPQLSTGFKLSDAESATSQVFHSDREIEQIIYVIKRLFIEQSPVWKYDDLWAIVRAPPFEVYVNPSTFSEANFVIALELLVYSLEDYVDVYTTGSLEEQQRRDIDRLFDHLDKKIMKSGVECQIIFKNGYYILFPNDNIFNTKSYIAEEYKKDLARMKQTSYLGLNIVDTIGYPEMDLDSWYRYPEKVERTVFNVTKYLKTSNISYNTMKYKFFSRFRDIPIRKLPVSVEVYGMDFHAHLVEDAVRYVFNVLTNPKMVYSELHDFYFKMLYFYDKLDMVLFADHLGNSELARGYKPYVTSAQIKIPNIKYKGNKYEVLKEDHKYNAFLMSSIIKSTGSAPAFNIDRVNAFIDKTRVSVGHGKASGKRSAEDEVKKAREGKRKITKVFSNMLPVGHFLAREGGGTVGAVIPRVYNPEEDTWSLATEFVEQQRAAEETVENNLIVGYYEKNLTGIDVKFKIRPPEHKIVKHSDSRMVERGSVCSTRKKEELVEVAKMLDIKLEGSVSIKDLCDLIKFELMHREVQSRRKAKHGSGKKRQRWFYLHFEPQAI